MIDETAGERYDQLSTTDKPTGWSGYCTSPDYCTRPCEDCRNCDSRDA